MGRKRVAHTPTGQIKSACRRLWLRSRERGSTLKRDKYTCVKCGKKQKKGETKVEVHHKFNIHWKEIIEYIRKELLVSPMYLETQCKDCHDKTK